MTITAHQVATQYQIMGTGNVIVMLHGWGCDWQIWGPLIPELTKSYKVIVPDLPAFGKSAVPDTVWSSDEYVLWLGEFLNQVAGQTPITLLGHSFGGKIAAQYAATQPAHLNKLILVDASGLPDPLSPRAQLQQNMLKMVPSAIKNMLSTSLRTRLLTKMGAATDHATSTPAQRQIMQRIVREDISKKLPLITVPTLLIWENMTKTHHFTKEKRLPLTFLDQN